MANQVEVVDKWQVRSYADDLAANIRAARARADLSQKMLAARMRRLGFRTWVYQTVGKTEHAQRPVTATEILGLALAMNTTVMHLMVADVAAGDHFVGFPGLSRDQIHGLSKDPVPGMTADAVDVIAAHSVTANAQGMWDRPVWWAGEDISAVFVT